MGAGEEEAARVLDPEELPLPAAGGGGGGRRSKPPAALLDTLTFAVVPGVGTTTIFAALTAVDPLVGGAHCTCTAPPLESDAGEPSG